MAADLVSTKEAAIILGCSVGTVKRKAKAGELPVAHKGEGTAGYLFNRSKIEALA